MDGAAATPTRRLAGDVPGRRAPTWGSSQFRESDERIEARLDALLRERNLDPENP
ncbi:hypothetical protein ACSNN9_23485 [Micromonospora sp. URMC 107]|uniref:hypothetical protein n=1 Tax=Micromonospora sp. URMC 107 TaxID=3423418 RepID=UPI003F1A5DAA